jgi:hypothetical protein
VTAAPNSTLVGVVSRDALKAEEFAARHGALSAHNDYQALLDAPAVDAVYIATPNGLHAEQWQRLPQAWASTCSATSRWRRRSRTPSMPWPSAKQRVCGLGRLSNAQL